MASILSFIEPDALPPMRIGMLQKENLAPLFWRVTGLFPGDKIHKSLDQTYSSLRVYLKMKCKAHLARAPLPLMWEMSEVENAYQKEIGNLSFPTNHGNQASMQHQQPIAMKP